MLENTLYDLIFSNTAPSSMVQKRLHEISYFMEVQKTFKGSTPLYGTEEALKGILFYGTEGALKVISSMVPNRTYGSSSLCYSTP